jgi:hypothetical protein
MKEYPLTLSAAKTTKGAEWKLADALLSEIGKPGKRDDARFRDCQAYLAENGIEYAVRYLRSLRNAAASFDSPASRKGITPNTAAEAGRPEVVETAKSMTGKAQPTKREIHRARKVIVKQQKKEGAKTLPQKKAAAQKAATEPTETRRMANVMKLTADASQAAASARKFAGDLAGKDLKDDERDDLIAEVEVTIKSWQVVLDALKNPVADEAEAFLRSIG